MSGNLHRFGFARTIPADIRAANLAQYSQLVTLRGIDIPGGSAVSWMIPNLDAFNQQFNIYSPTAENGAFKFGYRKPQAFLSPNARARRSPAAAN